jgi:hypothetical protein
MDVLLTQQHGQNKLFHNLGNTNHWIKFKLVGTASNRDALGAKVRVQATMGGQTIWQTREISAGGGWGENDLRSNFGLGDATIVDLVRIEWPSGNVQEFAGLTANRLVTITESLPITPTRPSASLNGSVTLTRAAVTGVTYQWQFEGADLAGQTNRTLGLTNIVAAQQGHYSVVASNATTLVTNFVYLFVDTTFTKITTGPLATELGDSWVLPGQITTVTGISICSSPGTGQGRPASTTTMAMTRSQLSPTRRHSPDRMFGLPAPGLISATMAGPISWPCATGHRPSSTTTMATAPSHRVNLHPSTRFPSPWLTMTATDSWTC